MTISAMAEFQQVIKDVFEKIPFNQHIGLEIHELDVDKMLIASRFSSSSEIIGNTWKQILHGGVIATALDATGSMTALVAAHQRLEMLSVEEKINRLSKLGTVDLRVDYLKPGRGKTFVCRGHILRAGNKLVVTRMELHNNKEELIATGTATYLY